MLLKKKATVCDMFTSFISSPMVITRVSPTKLYTRYESFLQAGVSERDQQCDEQR